MSADDLVEFDRNRHSRGGYEWPNRAGQLERAAPKKGTSGG